MKYLRQDADRFFNDISVYHKTRTNTTASKRKRIKKLITTVIMVVAAFFTIQLLIAVVYLALHSFGMPEKQASIVAGLGDVVVGVIAAIAVVFQLGQDKETEQKLKDIEEAKFILQYNQSFVQDENMCKIEELLEKQFKGKIDGPIIDDSNRQALINYLVYLEGLAAIVFRNVLTIETIDDLMAYRYFIAMNNKEVQEDQLFRDADYYRGCFKLYDRWKQHRTRNDLKVMNMKHSLDLWLLFEKYIDCNVVVRKCTDSDSLDLIAKIIYQTDNYIYPTAFGSRRRAKKALVKLMNTSNCIFSKENIFVATYKKHVVGAAVVLSDSNYKEIDEDLAKKYKLQSRGFNDVRTKYFNSFANKDYTDHPYILALCIDKKYRRLEIGTILFKQVVLAHTLKDISLDVLKGNYAISLYSKYGFEEVSEQSGYSLNSPAPTTIKMTRKARPVTRPDNN